MYLYKDTNKSSIHIFQFQKFIILILAYICWMFLYNFFLFKVNFWKLAYWWFNGMLMHDILPKIALTQKNDSTYILQSSYHCQLLYFSPIIIEITCLSQGHGLFEFLQNIVPHNFLCSFKRKIPYNAMLDISQWIFEVTIL